MDFKSKAELLYEDVKDFQETVEAIMNAEDATPSDIADALDFQKDDLKEKMAQCYKTRENYAHAATVIKAEVDILSERIKMLKARGEAFTERATVIDEVIKTAMTTLGENTVFTPTVTFELKASTPKVIIDDEEAVPNSLRSEPKQPAPSKTLIKKYLEDNPDCEFAHLEKSMDLKYKTT